MNFINVIEESLNREYKTQNKIQTNICNIKMNTKKF